MLGFSDATYGALLSLNGLLVVVVELPLTTWSRRFPSRTVMAAGYLLMGAGLLFNAWFHTLLALIIGIIVFSCGEMTFAPVAGAYVASLAPRRMRGRYMGAWGFSNSLSLMPGPGLGMLVFARSPAALWLGCGGLAVLAALAIAAKGRWLEPSLSAAVPMREDG
jgi:MFS family permease